MAFGGATSLGATGSTGNNQSSLALTLALAGVAVGELAVIVVADDNIGGGADADGNEVASITDNAAGGSNTWQKAHGWTNNMAGAQNGAHVSIWWTVAVRAIAITTGTITANFTNSTLSDATAMTGYKFTKGASTTIAVEATNHSSVTAGQPGALDAATANMECLRVRGIAGEVGTAVGLTKTAAFDSAWASGNSATTGTTAEMGVRAEHAISTGTGLSSNPTWSAINPDIANVYVAFKEVYPDQTLTPSRLNNTVTFGTLVVGRGAVDVHPSLFTNTITYGTLFAQLPYAGGQVTKLGISGLPTGFNESILIKIINEVVRSVESILTVGTWVRVVNETERLVEVIQREIFSDLIKLVNEAVDVVEALLSPRVLARMFNEGLQVAESAVTSMPIVRMMDEEVDLSEDALDGFLVLNRNINETVEIATDPSITNSRAFIIDEAVHFIEDAFESLSIDIVKMIDEAVNAVESVLDQAFAEITEVIDEAVHAVEVIVTQQFIIRMINEVERINESQLVSRVRVFMRNESVRINESLLYARALIKFRNEDSMALGENNVTFRPIVRMRDETERVGENNAAQVFRSLYQWLSDTIQLSELTDHTRFLVQWINESLHLSEVRRALTPIPSLVCSAIRLYALIAGQAAMAPVVMGSAVLYPEIDGEAALDVTVDGHVTIEECD